MREEDNPGRQGGAKMKQLAKAYVRVTSVVPVTNVVGQATPIGRS